MITTSMVAMIRRPTVMAIAAMATATTAVAHINPTKSALTGAFPIFRNFSANRQY